MGYNNIFLSGGNGDPLLSGQNFLSPNIDEQISQLDEMKKRLEAYKQNRPPMPVQGQPQQQQPNQTPVWDEIDKITSEMPDREFALMNDNEEFQQSQQRLMGILQREYMLLMRPIVESTKDGKDALDQHLTLVKRLRKTASEEAGRDLELFKEYTENYSDMPYAEFLKMKKGGGKKK